MNHKETSRFAEPHIDLRALLSLPGTSDSPEWGPIRAAQINAMARPSAYMIGVYIIAAAMTLAITYGTLPLWQIGGWSLLLVFSAILFAIGRKGHEFYVLATRQAVWRSLTFAAAMSVMWIIPALFFLPRLDAASAISLASVILLVMTIAAFAMAASPLGTITWLLVVGPTLTGALIARFFFVSALATLVSTGILILICFFRAKALVVVRANELALKQRDETVSLLLYEFEDSQSNWLWEVDAQRRIVRSGKRFAESLCADPATINGRPLLEMLAGESWKSGEFTDELRALAEKLKLRESFRELVLPVRIAGEEHWWKLAASPRFDDKGNFCGFRGVASDVTEQRRSEEKINRMARYDTLTGLPNRLMINETLAEAMKSAQNWNHRCAFMMIDLDRFKAVNDTLGHPVGDRLLRRVSERLGQLISDNEMIGRLGGDEFAVVIRDASDSGRVEKLALKIIDTLSQPYEVDQHTLYIGASVGVAVGPRDGRTAEMLVRSADLALYQSKDEGGSTAHYYDPKLHMQAEERRLLEIALRSALDHEQFSLHYQPVVDAKSGTMVGFEALLRWNHPGYGLIEPGKFIPLAEETHLINPIGAWVLHTACREAASWESDCRIAINVSSEQLHSPHFVQTVADALEESGLPAHRLELEVTESVFLHEGSGAISALEKLLTLGIKLSLDDFGTGYSALGYLSRIRFSTIKIDRSFVRSAAIGKRESVAILRAVVTLAESLGMATTAEGVESAHEHCTVRDFGCSRVQGYYFGRPLPVEEARRLINKEPFSGAAA